MRYLLCLILCAISATVSAQTVTIQPTKAEFTASVNHNDVIIGTTTPTLTNYTISVMAGLTQVLAPVSLGKPTPDGTNTISVPLSSITGFLALPKNTVYTAFVTAVGPGGTATGAASGPFAFALAPAAVSGLVVKP